MRSGGIACSIALLLVTGVAGAQSRAPVDVQRIADIMVRLCIGGGHTQAVSGTATGGADISLRSLDVKGNLAGEFKINKSSAEGLVNGIDYALTQVASDQADKMRDCLRPVRERLLAALLPDPHASPPNVSAANRGIAVGGNVSGSELSVGGSVRGGEYNPSPSPYPNSTANNPPASTVSAGPPAANQVLTTRNFFGPHDIPPLNFAAYGIVAFPQKFTSETRHRHISICEAYVATLPPASSSSAPPNNQMVTVWPIDNPSLAGRLNEQGESVCKEAVEHYDLNSGLIALKEAATQEEKDLSGQGPYLLAWAPSSQKGATGSLVLIADLSNATTSQHYREYFQKWRVDIERNPKLWQNGWSQADLIIIIRDWADKWGTMILSFGHADYKNE
jgi:hypothetical protein